MLKYVEMRWTYGKSPAFDHCSCKSGLGPPRAKASTYRILVGTDLSCNSDYSDYSFAFLCNSLTNSCNCGLDLRHHTRRAGAASKSIEAAPLQQLRPNVIEVYRSVYRSKLRSNLSICSSCPERCSWIERVSEPIAQYNVIQYKKKRHGLTITV